MTQNSPQATLSIADLPAIVTRLFARADRPLLPKTPGQPHLFLRYLRRKPGRGLAAIYHVDAALRRGAPTKSAGQQGSTVSLTLDETALDGAMMLFTLAEAEQAPLEKAPSGGISSRQLGLSVQAFPADSSLSALAASCDVSSGTPLFQALASATQRYLDNADWRLISAEAVPVRYKPGNRCVIRYLLQLERAGAAGLEQRTLPVFGKVYADPNQARVTYSIQERLYAEQASEKDYPPLLPYPLGMLEAMGLTLHEAVPPIHAGASNSSARASPALTGSEVFKPRVLRGRGGEVSEAVIPEGAVTSTAQALVRLHTSRVRPANKTLRAGAKEASRLRERAALLTVWYPAQAEEIKRLSEKLAGNLETASITAPVLAHGGFKSSQLLFAQGQVYVVDFDGMCLADPALDVGYFLAYLRPSGLWYQRTGTREWFEGTAAVFRSAYGQALLQHGEGREVVTGILQRARWYEAALLFKIATRRVNRLQSARPGELTALLNEVAACLAW
ncbi:MAG TPA: phosphotransferase [Ktedonobacterales bacterium]|jgi:hypothetical protein